jgi:hypothetical protein
MMRGIFWIDSITPLQGLKSILHDLLGDAQHSRYYALTARNEIINEHPIALKGPNTVKQDNVLFTSIVQYSSPERA